jgi:glycosyltransferase involved in cell wall biosynthesis
MYEYMVLGIPVIHSRLPVVTKLFSDDHVEFFRPDDEYDLEHAIARLYNDYERREFLRVNALKAVSEMCWEKTQTGYVQIFAG